MRRDTPGYHSAVSNQIADRNAAEAPLSREEGTRLQKAVAELAGRLGTLEEIHEAELEAHEGERKATSTKESTK
jgi:hypothetical protein